MAPLLEVGVAAEAVDVALLLMMAVRPPLAVMAAADAGGYSKGGVRPVGVSLQKSYADDAAEGFLIVLTRTASMI